VALTLPFTALPNVEVFAVDASSVQLAWRSLPPGVLSATAGAITTRLGIADRPGVGEIRGLSSATAHHIELHVDGRPVSRLTVRTAASPPGALIGRVATISDMHLGESAFGLTRTMRDPSESAVPYPLRCTIAAVREAQQWGAELIVFKGDITHTGLPSQWELFDQVLDEVSVPVMAVPGNHDVVGVKGSIDHRRALESRGIDSLEVQWRALGSSRIVAVDTTIPTKGSGTLEGRLGRVLDAVDFDGSALVFAHHHFEHTPIRYFWPPGVGQSETNDVMRTLADVNPDVLVSSGHTHRNRARTVAGMLVTEVGSVKDHPGVWAGYEIHEAAVRQTVRRVAEPSCVEWTDRTSTAVGGIWGVWSSGTIAQRSIGHRWPSTCIPRRGDATAVGASGESVSG